MESKDKRKLHVVEGYKGSIKKKIGYYKDLIKIDIRKSLMIAALVLFLGALLFLVVNFRTYSSVAVTDTYSVAGASDSSYKEFAGGVLKYTRDGISYLNMEGEEQWNYPYQIKTPFIETNNVTAAVGCKGGNDIVIMQKDGMIGEIRTTLPIEKISVSEQGIVCAILKNESSPKVICYDTAGNVLVEHDVSLSAMGYPMDAAISPDGEVLQVSYLYLYEGKIVSRVAYYNFGGTGKSEKDYQIACNDYQNTVVATGFYMDEKTSAVIGDNRMIIYKGKDKIETVADIVFDKEIQSVGYSDKYIAVVLTNSGGTGYELRMYNKTGKLVTNETFDGEYRNIKIAGNHIIMYDGKSCAVFMKNGVQKFDGEMQNGIWEIFPVSGMNKYAVMNANGMEHVRLVN